MLIKAGVDISRLNREVRGALAVAGKVFSRNSVELVVTSTFEGNHGAGSLHYANDAFDMRGTDSLYEDVKSELMRDFGMDVDCIWEGDHIHVEYDPKNGDRKGEP